MALRAADLMQEKGTPISRDIIYCLLQGCSAKRDLAAGRQVHSLMVSNGFDYVAVLGDHLIRLFASCGRLLEANLMFCKVAKPSVFTWHSIISAHTTLGESERAIELFRKMQHEGAKPDKFIFSCVLKACASEGALEMGKQIHDLIIRCGFESDVVMGSALIDMYAKCGDLSVAHKTFNELLDRNVVSWNTMITRYSQHGYGLSALELFDKMQQQGMKPERVTFSSILKACSSTGAEDQGKLIHEHVIKSGLEFDVVIGSTIVDMYGKFGNLQAARKVFDNLPGRDVVSWGAMIAGYVQNGHGLPALELFAKLQQESIRPSTFIFSCVLKACTSIGVLKQGRLIHDQIIRNELDSDAVVGSTLVDMYAKSGNLEEACKTFDELPIRDVVSWNAVIVGYAQHGFGVAALELFLEMQQEDVRPDRVTFLCALKACGMIGALGQGKSIHNQIIQYGLESDVTLGSALVDMYAKCGNLEEAQNLFNELPSRNMVSWGAIIAGYAQRGNHRVVRQRLEDMQRKGLKPNGAIYVNILAACSHAGQVEESRLYFKSMAMDHGIKPSVEHVNCMVDVLGRAGRLNEAKALLSSMPILPNITGWMSLLTSCRTYGNVKLGRLCFDELVQIEPDYASGYVLMSNLYADAHMWEHVHNIQELRKGFSAFKKPGSAWVEVKDRVQEFMVGAKSRRQSGKINAMLIRLRKVMKEVGYTPQLDTVELVLDEEDGY